MSRVEEILGKVKTPTFNIHKNTINGLTLKWMMWWHSNLPFCRQIHICHKMPQNSTLSSNIWQTLFSQQPIYGRILMTDWHSHLKPIVWEGSPYVQTYPNYKRIPKNSYGFVKPLFRHNYLCLWAWTTETRPNLCFWVLVYSMGVKGCMCMLWWGEGMFSQKE